MHLRILAVAGRPSAWVAEAESVYLRRLPRPWKATIDRIAPSSKRQSAQPGGARADESARILKRLDAAERMVLLDERGHAWRSRPFAQRLRGWLESGADLCFVIGGADGVDDECRKRANQAVSLSSLTLPHELARVVLLEQLYRASTIIAGHPYHRD